MGVEVSSIIITNSLEKFTLIALYKPPNINPPNESWEEFFSSLNSKEQIILLGDFNSHNFAWNCEKTDVNGASILNCLNKFNNIMLHNFDSKTRIDTRTGKKSNIDLIFSSLDIAHKISYRVHRETCNSDHYPIYINISINKHIYHKLSFKVQSMKTNRLGVNIALEQKYERLVIDEFLALTPVEKYEYFINLIHKTVQEFTPTKKKVLQKKHRNPVFWWDNECEKARSVRSASFEKWEYTNDLQDLIAHKKQAAFATQLFK